MSPATGWAQEARSILHLEQALQNNPDDSTRFQLYLELSNAYQANDFTKSEEYALKAVTLAEKIAKPWALTQAYRAFGLMQIMLGDYFTALQYSSKYLTSAIEAGDSLTITMAYNMIGDNYYDIGKYDEAYAYFTQSYRLAKVANDSTRMSIALHNVGRVFKELGQYDRAKDHLLLSRKMSALVGDELGEPYSLDELGDVLARQSKYDSAILLLKESVAKVRLTDDRILEPKTLSKIASVYSLKGDFKNAFTYYDTALAKYANTKNRFGLAEVELGRGIIYQNQHKYKEAQVAIEKSLSAAQQIGARTLEIRCYQQLADLWEKKGDYKKSLEYFKSYEALEDTLFNMQMSEKLFRDQMLLETESRDTLIARLSQLQNRQQSEIKRQEFIRNIFVVLGALASILLLTVYRSGQRRRRINKLLLEHQQETEKRSEELEKLNQVKDKFFSIISHDLRSPINALAGLLDLIDRGAVRPEDMTKNVQELKVRFNHARTLLNNLLDWTLLQMDKLSLQRAKVDIHKIVAENIQMLSSVQDKNITFNNEVSEGVIAFADSNTINLVIRNLMTNGIKFTNEGGHISIRSEDAGTFWKIHVSDDGVGMKSEVVRMLFDKTSPYSTRGTANEKGTGLGLILCKEFVEKNGGTISVSSEEGKGSTFTFTLPKG
jgi:signal transduction histidine kinase